MKLELTAEKRKKKKEKAKRNHRKATSPPVCRCLTTSLSVSDRSLSSFLNTQTTTTTHVAPTILSLS